MLYRLIEYQMHDFHDDNHFIISMFNLFDSFTINWQEKSKLKNKIKSNFGKYDFIKLT